MPSEAEGVTAYIEETSAEDDLPPHRAAIPVPPILLADALIPRRGIPWWSIALALGFHSGLLMTALLWGQGGEPLPGQPAISVELVARIGPAPVTTAEAPPLSAASTASEQQPDVAQATHLAELEAAPRQEAPPEAPQSRPPATEGPPSTPEIQAPEIAEEPSRAGDAAPAPPRVGLQATPPLPRKAPRFDAIRLARTFTANMPVAAINSWPARARSSARSIALEIYKQRVQSRIRRNAPIGDMGAGHVVIGARLTRSGQLLSALILESSGNPFLDRAALDCVWTAQPYPLPPPGIAPAELSLAIPFWFE